MYFRSTPQSLTCGLTEEELAMWLYSPWVKQFNPNNMEAILRSSPKVSGALVIGQGKFEAAALLELKERVPETEEDRIGSRRAVAMYHQSEPNCSSLHQDWSGPRFLHDGWEAYAENGQGHSEAARDEPSLRKSD